ncbi:MULTISPECIES: molybdopterin-dependent oxidoreductase [Shinella]|uniref:Molybdopterin-dependent oxidoreductase n=1 Tax=Shinella sedimenti TaxID=2919913 RepID=A0ABT0CQ94_9HYPH|nr:MULTISPECIES: molybdopterin-dependent oxidoreductase [Shinella]MCJ8150787.1 molybdopterin-dependent oxidoreductase [Shinella sedimenti]
MQIRMLFTSLALTALCFPTLALALDKPKGEVILTISAAHLDHPNIDETAQFDLPMLEALTSRTGEMETPWTEGKVKFSGPLLRAVLEAAGAHGSTLKIIALNDYSAEVPVEDAAKLDTILATRMNGDTMSVRDKGPLFLIYPFDKDASLFNEKYFSRSVWQIKSIEVSE